MSPSEFLDFVTPIGVALSAVASIAAVTASIVNGRRINKVHVEINSRMTELLEVASRASHSEGVAEGRLQEEIRRAGEAG